MGVFDNGFSFGSEKKEIDEGHVVVDGIDFEEGFVSGTTLWLETMVAFLLIAIVFRKQG